MTKPLWLEIAPHTRTPTHISHFYEYVSAYMKCPEEVDFLCTLIREGIKKAEETGESQIVDRDNMEHIFVCHPAGSISLYRLINTYEIKETLDEEE